MSDLSVSRAPAVGARLPRAALLYAAVGAAGLAGVLVGRLLAAGTGDMEWQLVLLLRFMAVVKGAMALGALALVQWRLRRPASARLTLGYAAALVPMALAPGLIWSLAAIAPGAACFHAGFLLFLVLAWRDDGVALPERVPMRGPSLRAEGEATQVWQRANLPGVPLPPLGCFAALAMTPRIT